MKLFLSGGGSDIESIEVDKKFIEAIDISKPVLYIPIAIDTIKHPYPDCLNWLRGNFVRSNFDNFIMCIEKDLKNKTENDFEQFGGVYIGGGNTFKLLSDLKKFGTFQILKSLAIKNIPIYGGSAGALVLTKSIIPASYLDKNEINLTDLSALDLIHEDIWCHYKSLMDADIAKFLKEHSIKRIIAIPEDAGLFVSEKRIEVIGPNIVSVISKKEKAIFHSGEVLNQLIL